MLVELGNPAPLKADNADPRVTYINFPDADENGLGGYTMPDQPDDSLLPEELSSLLTPGLSNGQRRALIDGYFSHPSGVKGLPNHEMFAAIIHPGGVWKSHAALDASWVSVPDHPALEKMLSDYFGCPIGAPADV